MKILLDESVPVQLRRALPRHQVLTVHALGWKGKGNGDLLSAAEAAGFDAIILADKNLRHQQNMAARRVAVIELWTNHLPTLQRHFPMIALAVDGVGSGSYTIVAPVP